jgi:tetrapyrrole methylase family protein/MazG family protein
LPSLDDEYEHGESFSAVYDAIVARVLRTHASHGDLVYAVPGHPLIGETTVARLLERTKATGVPTQIIGAPSFIDACLETLGESVTGDLCVVDAHGLDPDGVHPDLSLRSPGPVLLYQVHDRQSASRAKLALMRAGFPDEHPVTILRAAGLPDANKTEVPLYLLDRREHDHLTSVWVPPLPAESRPHDFDSLRRIVARLRDPESGCPWDLKQTHQSLKKYAIEEAYEVCEAIDSEDPDALCEELGDLLLQVLLNAQIASESGTFDLDDICRVHGDKLVRRHPHIFGEAENFADADAALKSWNAIKAAEKTEKPDSLLDGISASLPALSQALETSKRVVAVGFEWPEIDQVLDKVEEELSELRVELKDGTPTRIADELGDVLFTLVNVARKVGIDPEESLRTQLKKFHRRWRYIETAARAQNRPIETIPLAEQEALWQEAKQRETG